MILSELLSNLNVLLVRLKNCLHADTNMFKQNVVLNLEASNIEKLSINQEIQQHLVDMQAHSDWPAVKDYVLNKPAQSFKIQAKYISLLNLLHLVETTLFDIQALIQINHHVLIANQDHLMSIFENLVKISSNDKDSLYKKSGSTA